MTDIPPIPAGWALVADGWTSGDVVYHHSTGTYNVTRTYLFAQENPIIAGPFQVAVPPVELLERDPTIDKAKALTIPLHIATADPLLCIQLPSRHLLIIDGHHRLLRMVYAGIVTFRGYIVPPAFQPPLVAPQTRQIAACSADQLASQNLAKDLLERFIAKQLK
jgi:hypothetical protein